MVSALREFGFEAPELENSLFTKPNKMTRLGREPVKIEILNSISGLEFEDAIPNHVEVDFGGLIVPVMPLGFAAQ